MAKSQDAFRTISEVADWLDTPAHVLRFWESRFTQVKPVKRAGGRRYYRPADMELLSGIKKLLHEDGMTIKGVQKLLRSEGIKHVAAMSHSVGDVQPETAKETRADPTQEQEVTSPVEDTPSPVISFPMAEDTPVKAPDAAPEPTSAPQEPEIPLQASFLDADPTFNPSPPSDTQPEAEETPTEPETVGIQSDNPSSAEDEPTIASILEAAKTSDVMPDDSSPQTNEPTEQTDFGDFGAPDETPSRGLSVEENSDHASIEEPASENTPVDEITTTTYVPFERDKAGSFAADEPIEELSESAEHPTYPTQVPPIEDQETVQPEQETETPEPPAPEFTSLSDLDLPPPSEVPEVGDVQQFAASIDNGAEENELPLNPSDVLETAKDIDSEITEPDHSLDTQEFDTSEPQIDDAQPDHPVEKELAKVPFISDAKADPHDDAPEFEVTVARRSIADRAAPISEDKKSELRDISTRLATLRKSYGDTSNRAPKN